MCAFSKVSKTGEDALTWRVILAMLLSSIIFVPATLYTSLVGGPGMGMAGLYMIVLVVSSISRMYASPLRKQELFVIYVGVATLISIGSGGIMYAYYWILYYTYFSSSPLTRGFMVDGTPVSSLVTNWLAPPLDSPARSLRTFFHHDMFLPIFSHSIMAVCYFIQEFALTLIISHLFVETETLTFPFADVDASICTTLTERNPDKMRVLLIGLSFGLAYAPLLYFAPLVFGVQLIPLPFVDLTPYSQVYLPGSVIGLATDLITWFSGFIVPFNVAASMLMGSVATYIIGNNLFLTTFPEVFPEWPAEFFQGMGLSLILQRSEFRVWFVPHLGFSIGLAAYVLARSARGLASSLRVLVRPPIRADRHYPRLLTLLVMYFAGTGCSVLIFHFLMPEFPILIPIFMSVILSFFWSLVSTRALGETGTGITMPYMWHTLVYFSPYTDFPAWVFPPVLGGSNCPGWTNYMKGARLTDTRPMDVIKGLALGVVMATIFNFISLDFFWRIAPIPSSAYPNTLVLWPMTALGDALLVSRQIRIEPSMLLACAAIMVVVSIAEGLLVKLGISFSVVGLNVGTFTIPVYSIPIFVGALISRFLMPRLLGRERWMSIRSLFIAGYLIGEGLVVGVAILFAFVRRSAWLWPY